MKRFLFAVLMVMATTTSAFSMTVDILNSSYNYYLNLYSGEPDYYYQELEGSSNKPVEVGFSLYPGFYTDISARAFTLSTSSDSVELLPEIWDYGFLEGHGYAFASGSWVIQPTQNANDLIFSCSSDLYDASYISIFDLTDNVIIFDVAWSFFNYGDYAISLLGDKWESSATFLWPFDSGPLNFNLDHTFLSDHTYLMKMGTMTNSGGDSTISNLSANITAVPETSTVFLLIIGTICIYGSKRTSKFSKI